MKPKTETPHSDLPDSEDAPNSEVQTDSIKEKESPAPSNGGSSANLETIASKLSAEMPEVQEHAIEQEILNENDKLAQYSHLKDSDGNGFDPAVHKTNKAGEPTLSTKGKLIKKPGRKPGAKPGAQGGQGSVVGGASTQSVDKAAEQRMQARASGTMAANLILQIGIVAGGEEWHPRVDEQTGLNEKLMLENSFADYFEATGKTDIPPGMALTVAIGAYALPRFTMPKTQSRLSKLKMGLKQWWINRKLKKHGLKAEPSDSPKKQSDTLEA